ncbi:MAG: molybdopterin-dependent oxidoreductase [Coriobacteriia bacterium]|nr:molybdopterin-dependent oxidoreductase [Coriobacteriia bacterium]
MGITRRGFLQVTATTFLASLAYEFTNQSEAMGAIQPMAEYKLVNTEEQPNICCYCSGGCGSICSTRDGVLINIEGDPDHPVNRGGLCSKGSAQFSVHSVISDADDSVMANPNRLTKPKVRRAGQAEFEDISWDQAIQEIAEKFKKLRDETYIETEEITLADGTKQTVTVNRTEAIAELGAAMLDNEEAYLVQKLMRGMGVVYIDHQARV